MVTAVFPGSFDPPTNGHLEIIERSAQIFDRLIVVVMPNSFKHSAFTLEERVEMLGVLCQGNPKISVVCGWDDKLLAQAARELGASAVVKGLRNTIDFEYESQMAGLNKQLTGIDTLFLMTSGENRFISSSRVREIASLSGDVAKFVPEPIAQRVKARYSGGMNQ